MLSPDVTRSHEAEKPSVDAKKRAIDACVKFAESYCEIRAHARIAHLLQRALDASSALDLDDVARMWIASWASDTRFAVSGGRMDIPTIERRITKPETRLAHRACRASKRRFPRVLRAGRKRRSRSSSRFAASAAAFHTAAWSTSTRTGRSTRLRAARRRRRRPLRIRSVTKHNTSA